MVEVRQARREDGEDLLELWHGFTAHLSEFDDRYAHKESADERWLTSFENQLVDAKYGAVFVAEADDDLVGVLEVRVTGDHPIFRLADHGYINGHYVREGYRGRGIGADLVAAAVDWLDDHPREIEFCRVDVMDGDEAAATAYDELGFEPVEHVYEIDV